MKHPIIFILFAIIKLSIATTCNHDNVLRALLQKSTDASSFCATYLGTSSLSASVILYDVTIVGGTFTQTYGPTETATLFQAFSKTISTKAVTTSYKPQLPARTASSTLFSIPTPASYVATYPVSRISSACSCLSVAIQDIPVNVNCDAPTQYVSTETITDATVFTATGGKKTTTLKITNTHTIITSTQTIVLPFPTTCPGMANAEYVGADGSPWFRSCADSWGGSSTISTGTATNLDSCIDQCVANNQKVKYAQCIGVEFDPTNGNTCALLSFATYPNGNGIYEIAGLKFWEEPFPTLPPGFCESAVSSFLATASRV
ncbi:hypothetical protein N431DRAFT_432002 [Stipitochalara longipes BDJ]|nr:hypothetical protein N431DRAFT_432002 [Stipitochalara longipes BDJ]